jgi:hypothetical protein
MTTAYAPQTTADTGRIRDWLRESTPQPFASRNTWSGDRLLRRT